MISKAIDEIFQTLDPSTDEVFPTSAHQAVYATLLDSCDSYFSPPPLPLKLSLKPRFNRLISGPSGVGKSHMAGLLAKRTGAELFEVNFGEWTPMGSSVKPGTLEQIAKALTRHSRVILLIDEIDKIIPASAHTSWSLSCQNEIYALLERKLPLGPLVAELAKEEPESEQRELYKQLRWAVQKKLFILACGTWQDYRKGNPDAIRRTLGFGDAGASEAVAAPTPAAFDTRSNISRLGLIPEELRNRFHGTILELRYPDKQETQVLLQRLKLDQLAKLANRMDLLESLDMSSGGMRELESVMTDLVIAYGKQHKSIPVPAPSPWFYV